MQSEDGTVGREFLLRVLTEGRVSVTQQKESESGTLVLAKDGILDVRVFEERVGRRIVHTLARKFDIPIHLFYN